MINIENLSQIIDHLSSALKLSQEPSIIGTAGIIRWDQATQKKQTVDMIRPYGASIDKYPNDNIVKINLSETPYIVIDIDGEGQLDELIDKYPTLQDTFATTTTAPHKQHYYVLPPEGHSKEELSGRTINRGNVDFLPFGCIFEGHFIDKSGINHNPTHKWAVINDNPPRPLTINEWKQLLDDTTSVPNSPKNIYGSRIYRKEWATIVQAWVDEGTTIKQMPNKDRNRLIRALTPVEYLRDINGKKKLPIPEPSYDLANKMAYRLAMNSALPPEYVQLAMEKVITEFWDFDLNSEQTQLRLYKQILGTIPTYPTADEVRESDDDLQTLLKRLNPGRRTAWIYSTSRSENYFIEVNLDNMRPRKTSRDDEGIVSQVTVLTAHGMVGHRGAMQELMGQMHRVKFVNKPSMPRCYYDHENEIDVYNLAEKSMYQDYAMPIDKISNDNILKKAIGLVMGEYADFYYHWLAHNMFGRPPQTVLALLSPAKYGSETGKSVLAMKIPSLLIGTTSRVDIRDLENGWGDVIYGSSLLCFNDVPEMTPSKWAPIYSTIRDMTTAGSKTKLNMKKQSYVEIDYSICYSFSANSWIPLDQHDRRFFVLSPQFLTDSSLKPLTEQEKEYITNLFESENLNEIPEMQEIANYCLYLYLNEPNKYHVELRSRAPMTREKQECMRMNTTFSSQIIVALEQGAEELAAMVDTKDLENLSSLLRFVIFQAENSELPRALIPWEWFYDMLGLVSHEGERKRRYASVISALGISKEDMAKKISRPQDVRYRDYQALTKIGIDLETAREMSKWSTNHAYELPTKGGLIRKYRQALIDITSTIENDNSMALD